MINESVIVTVNVGSSSLRCAVFALQDGEPVPLLRLSISGLPNAMIWRRVDLRNDQSDEEELAAPDRHDAQEDALRVMLKRLESEVPIDRIRAFAHRIVHGGQNFTEAVRLDQDVLDALDVLTPLAPSHQPFNLRPARILRKRYPEIPQIACFDTAFHHGRPRLATIFGIPREMTARGIIRYGFHGLSYEYIARDLAENTPDLSRGRVIAAHLGHGASLCAMQNGHSVATTMGLTALDGLPMGKRCGALDPGVVLHLILQENMSARDVEKVLYERSGLLGMSGISDEMTDLLASDAAEAGEAVDYFVYRCLREIGSLAAALDGLDGLVFTGGIGENSPVLRSRICKGLSWLGIRIDETANQDGSRDFAASDSDVRLLRIPADEEMSLARGAVSLLSNPVQAEPPSRPGGYP